MSWAVALSVFCGLDKLLTCVLLLFLIISGSHVIRPSFLASVLYTEKRYNGATAADDKDKMGNPRAATIARRAQPHHHERLMIYGLSRDWL